MFNYNLITKPNFNINKNYIDSIFKNVCNIETKKQNGSINIVFLDDDSIQNLNNKYRKIDKVTDVLSFHYFDNYENLKKEDIAGELVFSESKIQAQGKEFGLGEEYEFYKLLIHSLLHILGHDHELDSDYTIMKNLEDKIWKEVFEK